MNQTLLFTALLFLAAFSAKAQPASCIGNNTGCEITVVRHCYDDVTCTLIPGTSSMPQVLFPGSCYTFADPFCESGETVYEFWFSDPSCPPPTQNNHVFISDASSTMPLCFPGPVAMPNTGCACAIGPGATITAIPCCITVQ